MQRFVLNVLTFVLLVLLAGVSALWVRSYFAADVIESYRDVPAPPLGQARPWMQRDKWQETQIRSYPGRFDVVWTQTTVKGRRHGPDFRPDELPGPIPNGWSFSQRDDAVKVEEKVAAGPLKRSIGAWQVDYIRPMKFLQADYQEIRATSGRGFSAPYWAVALALGVMPVMRAFNSVFRLGRETHDLVGYRIEGTGFRGQLGSVFRLASAGSLVLLCATGALWVVAQRVSVRLEGKSNFAPPSRQRRPEWGDCQTLVAGRSGVFVKSITAADLWYEPRPDKLPPCRIDLGLGMPAGGQPGGKTDIEAKDHQVKVNQFGIYVATVPPKALVHEAPAPEPTAPDPDDAVASVAEDDDAPAVPPKRPEPPPAPAGEEWIGFFPYWSLVTLLSLLPAAQILLYLRGPQPQKLQRADFVRGLPSDTTPGRPFIT
jgi:hypothetical protein